MASLMSQLRVLPLNKGECLDATLFRLEKGWMLHFVLGPSLAAKNVRVFTNHPLESASGPNRHVYREISWQNLTGRKSDVYDNFAEVSMVLCGSFNYYFTLNGSDERETADGSGYFLVDPVLRYGRYDERLPLDSVCCQTVLTKSLGPFPAWRDRLRVAKEAGYNMIHFTPVQELGKSNSAYALKDQLMLSPAYSPAGHRYTLADVNDLVKVMKDEWDVLSLTDLVYNHTANESPWIQEHPECAYNMINSPHLKPAYFLDRILWHFSLDVAAGRWTDRGIPPHVNCDDHLNAIRAVLMDTVLPRHKVHEYYLVHVDDTVQQYRTALLSGRHGDDRSGNELYITPDPKYRRLKSIVPIPLAIKLFYSKQPSWMSEDEKINASCGALHQRLQELNHQQYETIQSHLDKAVDNFIANARWRFVDPGGPRVLRVSEKEPLMYNYFTLPAETMTLEQEEAMMHSPDGAFCMAHNGWVMNDDPLRNFAEPGSNIYLRRELIPWGDSVKLRYGKKPEDCPYLWQHMAKYTTETARIFHGVRLDNCHSTPIHVAEYMLDEARKVRPDLYVIAELFTSSEFKDNIFINRLGLNSLIREGLTAWDSHELGRLVHRYGGHPVGAFIQPPARPLVPCVAHAIFMDQTHDNPSPIEKRTAFDLLPSAALVAMACCATGSNRGYDELVPHHINVVTEPRLYQSWTDQEHLQPGLVNSSTGIMAAKQALNELHQHLGNTGYNQVYVDQVNHDIVSVTRHNPVSHQSIVLVSRTVFSNPHSMNTGHIPPLKIPGILEEIILEAHVSHVPGTSFSRHNDHINGMPDYRLHMKRHLVAKESSMVRETLTHDGRILEFVNFPPSSVIAVRISLNPDVKESLLHVRQCLSLFGYRMHTYSGRSLKEISSTTLENIATDLSLNDINRVLYRCDPEERDDGKGFGAYNIPGYGSLTYCGLQGVMCVLSKIRAANDLGHPLCNNLREGDWLCQYLVKRLKAFSSTEALGAWFESVFKHLAHIPRYLIPCYFDAIVTGVFAIVEEVAWARMNDFIRNGSSFVRALGVGSVQFCSVVQTSHLPALSPNLPTPQPAWLTDETTGKEGQACVTISAGFPHFASGIFRSWGRDTFIALRGLLLIPGRHDDARFIILAFGGCLRHGLIPNLLGGGTHARYNCRDAVWWWLQCIQDYCAMVRDGTQILSDPVSRLYPKDDSDAVAAGISDEPLHTVIQEALQRHADGVDYRERNAGPAIDNDMSDAGFNVSVGVDWSTGFVYGGNSNNCGTWMDKMGSSDKAGNRGKPATPRDGSAVELVGLCASALRWLSQLSGQVTYPHTGVKVTQNGVEKHVTFSDWHQLIQKNFEQCFWIDTSPDPKEKRPDLVNIRGVYKDSYLASHTWTDYQLRPNVPIAMVVAPELFSPDRAWTALGMTERHLLGPLGMKTLAPGDWNYNGNYINSDDSDDYKRAKGFNYHQGPEWVWPMGYFLRAKLYFAKRLEQERPGIVNETVNFIKGCLSNHNVHIQASDWKSLPELTNQNGAVCADSCPAQAWSVSCILEVLYDMETKILN